MGTYDAGLWEYELTTQTARKVAVPHFPQLIVRDILIPDSTSLWVAVDGGGYGYLIQKLVGYSR